MLTMVQPTGCYAKQKGDGPPNTCGGRDLTGHWHPGVLDEKSSVTLSNLSLRSVTLSLNESDAYKLRSLSLAANGLTTLSLHALGKCSNLEALILNGNSLATIDLTALRHCPKLEKLWLHNNCLTHIDLDALSACPALRSLYLDGNSLHDKTVSLQPLRGCVLLRALRLGRNKLGGNLDITPVLHLQQLASLDVSASVKLVAYVAQSKSSAKAAAAALPPALRRRAATVVWKCEEPPSEQEVPLSNKNTPLHTTEGKENASSTAKSSPESFTYRALLVGFKDSKRFGVEALLTSHGATVTFFREDTHIGLFEARKADILLVKTASLHTLHAIKACGLNLPVVLIGIDRLEELGKSIRAECVLKEPLFPCDALTIASVAHASIKASQQTSFAQQVEERTAQLDRLQQLAQDKCGSEGPRLIDFSSGAVLPTSPVSSSESSPPTGVPTMSRDPFVDYYKETSQTALSPMAITPVVTVESEVAAPSGTASGKTQSSATPTRASGKPRQRAHTIDFARLRRRGSSSSCAVRNRVEDSALGMLFSRCGGTARVSEFHSVATLCRLPVCVGPALYHAALHSAKNGDACSGNKTGAGGKDSYCGSLKSSFSSGNTGAAHGVSYETFWQFWAEHLKDRNCEERLYNVLRLAHQCSSRIPADAVGQLATTFMMGRATSDDVQLGQSEGKYSVDVPNIAAAVLCYEFKGYMRSAFFNQRDLARARLCSSLLAAESGIYDGVASHLRIDRMRDICMSFSLATDENSSIGGQDTLTKENVISFNTDQGLLTARAVEAIFALYVKSKYMGLDSFAPMWLAVNDLSSASACNYFFGVLDVDQDGYLDAVDCAHFYIAKQRLLKSEGFVPVAFEHVWQSMVDNVYHKRTRSRTSGRNCISLAELLAVGEHDRITFLQSLLFIDDDMSAVNLYRTVTSGSRYAAATAMASF